MMHAKHALSSLESSKLREYQHFQRTNAVYALKAQTFFSLIPWPTAAQLALLLAGETAWWQGTRGLQNRASVAEATEQRSQPALEPAPLPGGLKHALVNASRHSRDFGQYFWALFWIILKNYFKIMIFPFKIWVQSKRAVFKRKINP